MRRKIALYIADRLVDLDDQSFILMNYTMEDLSNPTIVRNSFSKQVTLPGTANNNRIFGHFFRMDRKTQYGSGMVGVDFNVARRTPFVIYNEMNEIVEQGYIKLDEVSRSKGMVEYKVTLYGGLGSFFYSLMYNEDESKRTLADMRYKDLSGGYTKIPGHFGQFGGYEMVKDAWKYLADPAYDYERNDNWWCNIINFAPCYNGLPNNFSADKALVKRSSFDNIPILFPKSEAFSNLMVMSNSHTEWEMRDLRWYLQRPVFRVKALFDAICDTENNGGYEVVLDDSFFNQDNHLYWDGWISLPLIPAEDRGKEDAIVRLLSSMLSPAEYVISYAKMFGLVFQFDKKRRVTIMQRKSFFKAEEVVDLTDRINQESIKKTSILSASRFYQFGGGAVGEWATAYKADYGVDYAITKVDTGNEYNNEVIIATNGISFKDAVEVQERNLLYVSAFGRDEVDGSGIEIFRLPLYESVVVQQWKNVDGIQEMNEEAVTNPYEGYVFFYNPEFPLSDWLPKPQFHEVDNKAADGSNVLLVFNGMQTTPAWQSWAQLQYRLTDDTEDMTILNEGVPCWNFTEVNSKTLTELPSFRRSHTYDRGDYNVIDETFDWGVPKARGVNGLFDKDDPVTIYNVWWREYQRDRYDDDTFAIVCKVNLRGLNVGQDLMRKFFYFQGAIFVLNKITNHSLTTWDDTECEFIKVQDINNYRR